MLEVLHEKILVKAFEAQKTSAGNIDIPLDLQKKPSKGKVIAVGCGLKDRPMIIKKDAIVTYIFGAGTKIEYDGEELLAMRDTDCLTQEYNE
jgi:co-chaperonin GroES (HSP10)